MFAADVCASYVRFCLTFTSTRVRVLVLVLEYHWYSPLFIHTADSLRLVVESAPVVFALLETSTY